MITIHFRNDHIVFVDKPSGYLSVPSRMGAQDPRPVLGLELQAQLGQPVYPVHRLDFEVSGLMVFALTPEAHRSLNQSFEKHQVIKTYQAYSQRGNFQVGISGTWKCHMLKGKKRAYEKPWGDLAVTEFEVIDHWGAEYYEWRLRPKTGRSHQLRYELFRHGSPILGDALYQSEVVLEKDRIALRSVSLSFELGLADQLGFSEHLELAPLERPF